jgi:hypothetical protein
VIFFTAGFACKAKAAAAAAAAAAATFSTGAAAAAAAHETTEKEKNASDQETLFVKTKGQRDGNAGHYYKCPVPGCDKKDSYFVKTSAYKYTAKIQHPSSFCVLVPISLSFLKSS